jgi:hypothetical protein
MNLYVISSISKTTTATNIHSPFSFDDDDLELLLLLLLLAFLLDVEEEACFVDEDFFGADFNS